MSFPARAWPMESRLCRRLTEPYPSSTTISAAFFKRGSEKSTSPALPLHGLRGSKSAP